MVKFKKHWIGGANLKKVNEEDYLDSLLKSMTNKVEESDDDKAERLLKEQIKEAVQKTHLQQDEMELEYSEPAVSEIKIENETSIESGFSPTFLVENFKALAKT